MRYALILAGGSGVRLWPMSRTSLPKQLIPFIGGRSLLELAVARLEGLVPADSRYICGSQQHRETILKTLRGFPEEHYLGEPAGRDTLAAVGLSAAVIARRDPEAVIAVFTADHLIEPVEDFRRITSSGFELVESRPETLVTFGITPKFAATGYGYIELGAPLTGPARIVDRFQEKPGADTARRYFDAGPDRYLWNSGMFVWRAATLLDCIRRYQPETHRVLLEIAAAWDTPERDKTLSQAYSGLQKISVDYAVMEPASRDASVRVAAIPMPLTWLDVGSWPSFAETCASDEQGNAIAAKSLLQDCSGVLAASSDPEHLIAAIGCEDLLIIHTPEATLVCPANQAEAVKRLHQAVAARFGAKYV